MPKLKSIKKLIGVIKFGRSNLVKIILFFKSVFEEKICLRPLKGVFQYLEHGKFLNIRLVDYLIFIFNF